MADALRIATGSHVVMNFIDSELALSESGPLTSCPACRRLVRTVSSRHYARFQNLAHCQRFVFCFPSHSNTASFGASLASTTQPTYQLAEGTHHWVGGGVPHDLPKNYLHFQLGGLSIGAASVFRLSQRSLGLS